MKSTLRKKYKQIRLKLTNAELNDFSEKIFEILTAKFNLTNKNVSIFLPIQKFNEVNTWHLINKIKANYYLPVVKKHILQHIKYENKQQLKLSDWGILEPTFGEQTKAEKFDFVIVPLLAYDKKGNRIGYGAGFYDGFLKNCNSNCVFIGVSFFEPENSLIDTYPTDIPLHFCVTPTKVIEF